MSVKIEILDYVYGETKGTQMLSNTSFTSSSDWDLGSGWTISGGSANHSGSNGFLRQDNIFFQGQTYRIKYKISGRTQGSLILANHLAGGANGFVQINNGTFEYDWVQGGSNTTRLSLAGFGGFDGSVEYVNIYPISGINWEDSIEGELDITDHSDFPLALTFQVSEIRDVTSTTGDYSKSFKIPATKNNNKIFKHLYNPSIDHPNTATENKPCRILINNLYSLVGSLKVTGIGGYGDTASYYNCVFYGNNLGWGNGVEGLYMDDINWGTSGEGLTYNKASITTTWLDENCDSSTSPIVYPIVSYGNYNPNGISQTIQLLDTQYDAISNLPSSRLGYYGFENSNNPYATPEPVSDWRPAIFVKDTLEKIFSQTTNGSYSINSTFMDTDMFKKLVWVSPKFQYNNTDERNVNLNYGNTFTGEGLITSFLLNPVSTSYVNLSTIVDLNDAGSDFVLDSNLDNTGWDPDGILTIQEYGYYAINLSNFGAFIKRTSLVGGTFSCKRIDIELQVQTVGQTSWNVIGESSTNTSLTTLFTDSSGSPVANNPSFTLVEGMSVERRWLNKNDKLRLRLTARCKNSSSSANTVTLHLFGASDPDSETTSVNANGKYRVAIDSLNVSYGQTYDLKNVMNDNLKQVDFIKGITHAFNLKMTTNETTKVVNVEPADSFYLPYGSAVDWTYKLDKNKETQDKFLKSELKRNFVFKYKTDSNDKKVEYRGKTFFNGILDEYPYQEQLPSNFEKGDSIFENPFFAGTFNAKDQDSVFQNNGENVDTTFSACLWSENVSANDIARPDKGYEFEPRLLYWNKYSPTGSSVFTKNKYALVQTWTIPKYVSANILIPFVALSNTVSNVYPQATSINRDDSSSPVLSYGNVWRRDYDDATEEYTAYSTGEGLYETYYRKMFEMFKLNPRVRTVYVDLKISDIINLDFRKLIYIDGCYWRLNKISDYMPNKNQPTKVELIEWFETGAFSANAPTFGNSYNGQLDIEEEIPSNNTPL